MRSFYQLLGNTIIATVTNMTVWFAVIFYLYLQTKAVFTTSLLSGIYLATVALTGIWFGQLVDHHRKKNVMLVSNLISLVFYVLGFLIYLNVDHQVFTNLNSPVLWVFAVVLLLGVIAGNIRGIALPTVITLLVPTAERDKANGLAGTANGIGFLITSVISGFLVGHSGMYWVLILGIVTNVIAIAHLWTIAIPEKKLAKNEQSAQKIDVRQTLAILGTVPGLLALIVFSMFNNFLGGVFMALMDAYGLSLVSVQVWGTLWGVLSCAFIVGGGLIAKFGLGKNPLRTMFLANLLIWFISSFFTAYPSIVLLCIGMFIYLAVVPAIQAAEFTIIQKVVPAEKQGRVFGFAQSVEQAASPLTAFAIGPLTQFVFIPFMTDGWGAQNIGSWFGTGSARGIALVFTVTGVLGFITTLLAMQSKYYRLLSERYIKK